MKKYVKRIILILMIAIAFLLLLEIKSYGAVTISVSPSVSQIEPGKTFNVTIKVSGGAGYVNVSASNATISGSTYLWLDNSSETLSCTAGNTDGAKISISANGVIADYTTEKDIEKKASATVTIKKKEVEQPKPTTTTQTNTQKPTQTTQNTKPTTTNKTTTTTTKPKEEVVKQEEVNKEEEEAHKLGIYYVYIEGIKENGEKEEVKLDKEFNYDIFEYSCNVSENINKLELQKEAYEYNDLVQIEGTENELNYGENIITLKVMKDEEQVTYTIKVFKEGQEKLIEKENNEQEYVQKHSMESINISMPLEYFIILQIAIIGIEIIIFFLIFKRKVKHS